MMHTMMHTHKSIVNQLTQLSMPLYLHEKVYAIAKEIQLLRPEEFKCLFLCLGTFHTMKTLMNCIGKSLSGSGVDTLWQTTGHHGATVIEKSILSGGHYNRAVEAYTELYEAILRLQYKEFFKENGVLTYHKELEALRTLKELTKHGKTSQCKEVLDYLPISLQKLMKDFVDFKERKSKESENFKFWDQFTYRHSIVLNLLRADREGNWLLHLHSMQEALYEFAAWDSTNYSGWGSVYLEKARNLQESHPEIYQHFMNGSFSINDSNGRFVAVGGDQKLEQSINLS